ncbi:MAG: GIY-YIG nuclease family protein [Alphaproteobacteria bacterium]|nr:GIY-YIG nuclease family protein [Alphaproteobacteria bacterium]
MYYVYIMASNPNGTLYIGVTNDIARRVFEHKTNENKKSFVARYKVYKLVYVESYNDVSFAIDREKQLKRWTRNKKKDLIESLNPDWEDLYDRL